LTIIILNEGASSERYKILQKNMEYLLNQNSLNTENNTLFILGFGWDQESIQEVQDHSKCGDIKLGFHCI
jgi:hypothetical protein